MMRVIIDQEKTIARVFDFKTTTRVLELAQRGGNFFKGNPEFGGERDHADGIVDVVLAGNIQHRFAKLFALTINAKNGREIAQLNTGAAIVRFFRKTVRDSGFSLGA